MKLVIGGAFQGKLDFAKEDDRKRNRMGRWGSSFERGAVGMFRRI